jgi:nucleotide-binding universal stress UspA family protein
MKLYKFPTIMESEHLVQHHTDIDPTRVVCIGMDQSEHAQHALDWAITNVLDRTKDHVYLLNVREPVAPPAPYGIGYMDFGDQVYAMEVAARNSSHELLKQAALQLGQFHVTAIALRGDTRTELCRKAKEVRADVLVVGSRGLGAVKRLVLGSTSDYLVQHAEMPVIVVK